MLIIAGLRVHLYPMDAVCIYRKKQDTCKLHNITAGSPFATGKSVPELKIRAYFVINEGFTEHPITTGRFRETTYSSAWKKNWEKPD